MNQAETLHQESARPPPITISGALGETLNSGYLFNAQTAENVELHHLSGACIELTQLCEALVQSEHIRHIAGAIRLILIGCSKRDFAAAFEAYATARVVDQYLTHGARRERQKVRTLKFLLL